MRKMIALLLSLLLLCGAAWAEAPQAEAPDALWYAEQYAALTPPGVEARRTELTYALPLAEGRTALSLCLTVEGDIRFGRYDQVIRAALLDGETGEPLGLDMVFADLDALQDFLDTYVEERVIDGLNTYLDAADLLPVPLDAVSFDASGVTFHYPSERFMFFSGHAGAVHLAWYELAEQLLIDPPQADARAEAAEGRLGPLALGGDVEALLEEYGSLTDPDLVADGWIYEFEAPALRGVQAIADDAGTVTALRSARFEVAGVCPGMTSQQAEEALGEPLSAWTVEADDAEMLRLQPGAAARYEGFTLYYDEEGCLLLMEVSGD